MPTAARTGMSPSQCPDSAESRRACAAMIPACTMLDHAANRIKLRCAAGFRDARAKKTPSVAYTPSRSLKNEGG